jgi:hypothetical protein
VGLRLVQEQAEVHPQVLTVVPEDGTWSGTCYFGTPTLGRNEHYTLFIVTLTADADADMRRYLKGLQGTDDYPGWDNLPARTDQLRAVEVFRP